VDTTVTPRPPATARFNALLLASSITGWVDDEKEDGDQHG
jgi:hypothetical protein